MPSIAAAESAYVRTAGASGASCVAVIRRGRGVRGRSILRWLVSTLVQRFASVLIRAA
jgi:hypothetical protein